MLKDILLNAQSSIRIISNDGLVIYFDPYKLENIEKKADYIFITHAHYDHFSMEDIEKIMKSDTKFIVPLSMKDEVVHLKNIFYVKPNETYKLDNLEYKTIPAYNTNKKFHLREYNWVGYIINIDDNIIYIAGDTDNINEIKNIKCDIAFVPIGGIYTMDVNEAVSLIKNIRPNITIPIHYKTIVGSINDAYKFKSLLNDVTDVRILMD